MTTLTKLQELNDVEFHALGDELLPRISSDYSPIVPNGRNLQGDSIIGNPDSYVGNSADECAVAIEYTVQKEGWWNKVIKDIEDAKSVANTVNEIVVCLPRDIDREKPKKGAAINWLDKAKNAAEPAELTIIHGKKIAQLLDTTCQDLRLKYLKIPISRSNWHGLKANAAQATNEVLLSLQTLDRYSPEDYATTAADSRIFRLWQVATRNASGRASGNRKTLLPIVADAGIGKTNLLAAFVSKISDFGPTLLLLARDLTFENEGSLVRHVVEKLQGMMNITLIQGEERHLAMMLAGKMPLTVVLDGVDEANDSEGIGKAITYWLTTALGRQSVLVTSSRPDFWRRARNATWADRIVQDIENPKAAKLLRHQQQVSLLDPMQGVELPSEFTTDELSDAWLKRGRTEDSFWLLPSEVRSILKHPFTFMSAMNLIDDGGSLNEITSRANLIKLWLNKRLELEKDSEQRISADNLSKALQEIAILTADEPSLWVNIENLGNAPRFSAENPPGPVVERLIAANILQTHATSPDRIRFTFESVQDYFLAEANIERLRVDPKGFAQSFESSTLSNCATQLECIGMQIGADPAKDEFVRQLVEIDSVKAALVLRPNINLFKSDTRAAVCDSLGELLSSRFLADQEISTQLLGRLKCSESTKSIKSHWLANQPYKHIHHVVAYAAVTHSVVELVPLFFQTPWFIDRGYFVDIRPELMASSSEFREALAEHALKFLPATEHSDGYRRALTVLAYLQDDRAAEAIDERTKTVRPYFYESLCLLAIGSEQSIEVFSRIADQFFEYKKENKDENAEYAFAVFPTSYLGSFCTDTTEKYVLSLVHSDQSIKKVYGLSLVNKFGTDRLLKEKVKHWNVKGYRNDLGSQKYGELLGADSWLELWSSSPTNEQKKTLVQVAGDILEPRIESILIQSLTDLELAGQASQSLAKMGSERACPGIRKLLRESQPNDTGHNWNGYCAFRALWMLRDPDAVDGIVEYLESDRRDKHGFEGALGLAAIGTDRAEQALFNLKSESDQMMADAFLYFGTKQCVEEAIAIAERNGGPKWLLKECRFCFTRIHGWSSHKFRVDVEIDSLLDYVMSVELDTESYDRLLSMLKAVDSPSIRTLFREFYDNRNTESDVNINPPVGVLSSAAYWKLCDRGDDHVVQRFVDEETKRMAGYIVHASSTDRLEYFDRRLVLDVLRSRLSNDNDDALQVSLIDFLGFLGRDDNEVPILQPFIESESNSIANAAYSAHLRLTDPLRLAENW